MKVGDLVKWKRDMFRAAAPVGVVVRNASITASQTAWWNVLWSTGKIEIVSDQNLLVVNHASG